MTQMATNGLPGISSLRTATPYGLAFIAGSLMTMAGFRTIDGTKTADSGNTPDVDVIRPGTLMGKVTSGGKYANSVIGVLNGAITGASTTVTVAAEVVTELVRRIGSSGTFKITGPPAASGTARTLTATYSAASGTSITITALGVAQVDRIKFDAASTAGNLKLTVQKTDGTFVTTANIAWNATDATYLASINSALDTATGNAGGIVATAISAVDTDLGFELTYANASYPTGATAAQVQLFPTGSAVAVYTRQTTAVDGRFVTASFIQPTDGSETPLGITGEEWPLKMTDAFGTRADQQLQGLVIGGAVRTARIINWPSDTGLATWLMAQLRTYGHWTFDQGY